MNTYARLLATLALISIPTFIYAHPADFHFVTEPEIIQEVPGTVGDEPDSIIINTPDPIDLTVNVTVPDVGGSMQDVTVVIIQNGNVDNPIAVLDGSAFNWTQTTNEQGNPVWQGPTYSSYAPPGNYEVRVMQDLSDINNGALHASGVNHSAVEVPYVIEIGDEKQLTPLEEVQELAQQVASVPQNISSIWQALRYDTIVAAITNILTPRKDSVSPEERQVYAEGDIALPIIDYAISSVEYVTSPHSWGIIGFMSALAFAVGIVLRALVRSLATRQVSRALNNLNSRDRALRFGIGLVLLFISIATSWSALLIFIAGYAFFESAYAWGVVPAVLGKSSLPVD